MKIYGVHFPGDQKSTDACTRALLELREVQVSGEAMTCFVGTVLHIKGALADVRVKLGDGRTRDVAAVPVLNQEELSPQRACEEGDSVCVLLRSISPEARSAFAALLLGRINLN